MHAEANGALLGVILVGYTEREFTRRDNTRAVAYGVSVLLGDEVVALDLEAKPNGSALPVGTVVDVECRFVGRRNVATSGDRQYVGRAAISGKALAVVKSRQTVPAAA